MASLSDHSLSGFPRKNQSQRHGAKTGPTCSRVPVTRAYDLERKADPGVGGIWAPKTRRKRKTNA